MTSRYTAAGTYTKAITGYTVLGQPTGVRTTIPTAEGALAGTYTSAATYSSTGLQLTGTPAPAGVFGELEPNTLIYSYTHQGRPLGVSGNNAIVTNTVYDGLNQVAEYALGVNNDSAWLDYLHDPQSHKTTQVQFSGQLAQPQIDRTTYSYNPAGMLTSISDVQGPDGSPIETQCFRYDTLARLDQAYTAASGTCVTAPTASAVGGPNPYWLNWTFTNANSRASQLTHGLGGTADRTTNYTNGTTGHAHAVASTSTATSGGSTTTASYSYDAAGNTLTASNAVGDHVMTWTAEGRLDTDTTSIGKTSNTYDADGNLLLRHDPAATTLFLDSEELSVNTTTNVVTGTRYFTFNGQTLGIGINDSIFRFVIADMNGTSQISYDTTTHASVRRQIDPYGNQVGPTSGGAWPDNHGFLNAPQAINGFTHLGARDYDPACGRFLSVDPVFDPFNPVQDNGYNYGWNSPLSHPDPSGLRAKDDDGYTNTPGSTPVQPTANPCYSVSGTNCYYAGSGMLPCVAGVKACETGGGGYAVGAPLGSIEIQGSKNYSGSPYQPATSKGFSCATNHACSSSQFLYNGPDHRLYIADGQTGFSSFVGCQLGYGTSGASQNCYWDAPSSGPQNLSVWDALSFFAMGVGLAAGPILDGALAALAGRVAGAAADAAGSAEGAITRVAAGSLTENEVVTLPSGQSAILMNTAQKLDQAAGLSGQYGAAAATGYGMTGTLGNVVSGVATALQLLYGSSGATLQGASMVILRIIGAGR